MTERISKELALLRAVFRDVEYREVGPGWFLIPRFTVQFGGWTPDVLATAFETPGGYPGSPPYAFWVSPPPRLAGSRAPPVNNYHEPSPTPFPGTWAKFSWSHDNSWRPGPEPADGTNFLNFVLSFRDHFRQGP